MGRNPIRRDLESIAAALKTAREGGRAWASSRILVRRRRGGTLFVMASGRHTPTPLGPPAGGRRAARRRPPRRERARAREQRRGVRARARRRRRRRRARRALLRERTRSSSSTTTISRASGAGPSASTRSPWPSCATSRCAATRASPRSRRRSRRVGPSCSSTSSSRRRCSAAGASPPLVDGVAQASGARGRGAARARVVVQPARRAAVDAPRCRPCPRRSSSSAPR